MPSNRKPEDPISREGAIKLLRERKIAEWNTLREANPGWNPSLKNANLSEINLELPERKDEDLRKISHWAANLDGADLRGANFENAKLAYVSFKGTMLRDASFKKALLYRTDFEAARIPNAKFQGATFWMTNFEGADVTGIEYNRKSVYRGIRVATCYGSPKFRRFAQDQDFLNELKSTWSGKIIYVIWLVLADCGRSFWPWALWSVALAVLFGVVYFDVLPLGSLEVTSEIPWSRWTAIYYSVVTFTTLGFGDVVPKTLSAATWVMAEVIIGYVMLGGLISILATKLARRG